MNTTSTLRSWPAIAGGVVAASGSIALLVRDAWSTGVTLEHVLMPALVGLTVLAAHVGWQAARDLKLAALPLMALAVVGSGLIVIETMGRRAETRDVKVSNAVAQNEVRQQKLADRAAAAQRLADANVMVRREMTGERCLGRCQDWKIRVTEVEAKVREIDRELSSIGAEQPVDPKAERIAAVASLIPGVDGTSAKTWAATLDPFALPLFLELCSIFMFGHGLGQRKQAPAAVVPVAAPVAASDTAQTSFPVVNDNDVSELREMVSGNLPEPPKPTKKRRPGEKRDRVTNWVRDYTMQNGHPPAFTVVRGRFHLSKATASRYRQEGMKEAV